MTLEIFKLSSGFSLNSTKVGALYSLVQNDNAHSIIILIYLLTLRIHFTVTAKNHEVPKYHPNSISPVPKWLTYHLLNKEITFVYRQQTA